MKIAFRTATATAAALLLSTYTLAAAAEDLPEEYTKRPQVVHEKMLQLRGDIGLPLHNGTAGQGITVAPSAEYGITNEFQLALRHENSLCFNKCGDAYKGFGVEGKYLFYHPENFSLSAFAAPYINNFDPFLLQGRVGMGFWVGMDKFAINGNVGVGIGLTNRDLTKQDRIALNVQPSYNFTPQFAGFVDTGFNSSFDKFGDNWAIPLGVGALYTMDKKLDLGGSFIFPRLIAAPNTGGADLRQLNVFVRYRFDFTQ